MLVCLVKLLNLIDGGSSQFRTSWFVHPSTSSSVYKFFGKENCEEVRIIILLLKIFDLLTSACTDTRLFFRFRRSKFCKDHRHKIEVPDPLAVEDLISDKLNNKRKLARLIKQYRDIFSNISEGRAVLLQGVRKYGMASKKKNNNKRLIDRAK